jgi:hypothetical protein
VILLLPMGCFFLSSPAFLLVGPFAAAARPIFAVGTVAVAIFAIAARRWFLQRIDVELQARDGSFAGPGRALAPARNCGLPCCSALQPVFQRHRAQERPVARATQAGLLPVCGAVSAIL